MWHKLPVISTVLTFSFLLVSNYNAFAFKNQNTFSYNVYQAGEVVTGRSYSDLMKMWENRAVSVLVGIDSDNNEQIIIQAETSNEKSTVHIDAYGNSRNKLEAAITKALEWVEVARKNKADTYKLIDCFGKSAELDSCKKSGRVHKGQISISFFSSNNGKQTDLILKIMDRDNQFFSDELYISPPEMKKLLNAIKSIASKMKHARDQHRKQGLFK